jgi:hypothetical protein
MKTRPVPAFSVSTPAFIAGAGIDAAGTAVTAAKALPVPAFSFSAPASIAGAGINAAGATATSAKTLPVLSFSSGKPTFSAMPTFSFTAPPQAFGGSVFNTKVSFL